MPCFIFSDAGVCCKMSSDFSMNTHYYIEANFIFTFIFLEREKIKEK